MGLMSSLLLYPLSVWPARASERVEVQIDGIVLPISVEELSALVRYGSADNSPAARTELATWMRLLDPASRDGLIRLLKAPVLTRRSLGRQLLSSWGAGPLLDALGELIRVDQGERINSALVLSVLEQLLEQQESVSTLDVLEALPNEQLRLDLDALLKAASRWRRELKRHQSLTAKLGKAPAQMQGIAIQEDLPQARLPQFTALAVPHRDQPLQVERWVPTRVRKDRTWILLMPGLGGEPNHFHWLARALMQAGWPVALVEHPGSDAAAVKALLEGRQSFNGAEALQQRLADVAAVLEAQQTGHLDIQGDEVVLVGHSLGALTALLVGGARPGNGMLQRCDQALSGLPLTNLSELLQCELAAGGVLKIGPPLPGLRAVVGLNSFGGLIWSGAGTVPLSVPMLLFGGTLDLITPPLDEQIGLLASLGNNPASRVVVVEGASHFSPIRVDGQAVAAEGDDLFRLGEELVGVNPLKVQQVISLELVRFLQQLPSSESDAGSAHFIDASASTRWHRLNRRSARDLQTQ